MQPKERVLSFEAARSVVEQHAASVRLPAAETVALHASLSRILAAPIAADRDVPPFPRAMRDGYAVRAADLAHLPARLNILGEIKAGGDPSRFHVESGQAVSIMTGAPAPAGADAVVMVEHTSSSGDVVEVAQATTSFPPEPKLVRETACWLLELASTKPSSPWPRPSGKSVCRCSCVPALPFSPPAMNW
jgi:molybdopterin biosynthesis enzyme